MPARQPRLIVLPPSHYCERARWALDHAGAIYKEERWAAGPHVMLAKRLARNPTLPIFDTGAEIVQGSDRILDWAKTPGSDPALERRLEARIGPLVRQYLYAATLDERPSSIPSILFDGVAAWQAVAGRLMWPVTRRLMIRSLNARAALVPKLEQELAAELDWFDGHLGGRRYLVSNSFGRADITAASLLAPLARPAEHPLYRRAILPPQVEEMLTKWSGRPSMRWVTSTYAEHRRGVGRRVAADCSRLIG